MKKLKLEEHGLLPLSPSHINRFITEKPIWLLRKFYGMTSPYNLNMLRGHIVEEQVEIALKEGKTPAKETVVQHYQNKAKQSNLQKDEKYESLQVGLHDIVAGTVDQLNDFGTLISAQDWLKFNFKVEIDSDVYDIPFTGRTDFHMETKEGERVIVDLKTTAQLKSFVPWSTRLQQVLYARATNFRTSLLYVGYGKRDGFKHKWHDVDNDPRILSIVQQTIVSMEKLLRITDDKELLKQLIVPNPDDWSWNDPVAYRMRKEVWGW